MKGWKAIASALLLLVGISGAASAQDWSHEDRRDAHNYQIQQRDRDDNWNRTRTDGWYNSQRYGRETWQAPHRTYRSNRDDGYSRRGDRGRNDDRR